MRRRCYDTDLVRCILMSAYTCRLQTQIIKYSVKELSYVKRKMMESNKKST